MAGLPGVGAKIEPAVLDAFLAGLPQHVKQMPPRGLSISQATECGLVYSLPEIAALAKERGFVTLQNEHPERGQSGTIRLGTRALSDCGAICFMVADQPLLRCETLAREVDFFSSHREHIVALGHNGVRGNPCLFPARFFPELLALEGDVGGGAVIRKHLDALLLFPADERELRDADTKDALAAITSL